MPNRCKGAPLHTRGDAQLAARELMGGEFTLSPDMVLGTKAMEAVSAAPGVWDEKPGQLVAYQLAQWMLTKGQVRQASGLNISRCDTEQWLAPIKPNLQHLAAASSAGTSLEANRHHRHHRHWQRLRLYGAQDQFFKKLEEEMTEASMECRKRARQLVVFFGAAGFGTRGGWGADAVLRACCKVVCWSRGTERVVLVDEHRTSQARCSRQAATQPAASEPGPSTPPPAKHSRRTKAEQAAEPTQPTKGKGKAKGRAAKRTTIQALKSAAPICAAADGCLCGGPSGQALVAA
ncbi:hypothetical protein QJQ45_001160 [Haematococcus lacustris]|nr:hypothetical protein QJQ45_001160 [Haematococcus lacustris]